MKLITRDTDYAVRSLLFIARQEKKTVPVSDLVKGLHIPRAFLRKILQSLNKKRILRSFKGSGGGFVLAKPLQDIYLSDLMAVFQGGFKLNECVFLRKRCPNTGACYLRKKVCLIEKKVARELGLISLASLSR